jgi:FkbM family methyltransferase
MLGFIKKKVEKIKSKRSLQQYGWKINRFDVSPFGKVDYAQWLHPYDKPKAITPAMIAFYSQYIKEGDTVIDIGAHTGDTTVPMALSAGKTGTVLGLEPNPYVFKILEQNSKLNTALAHIVPLNFAATDHDGTFTFNYSDASYCNGGFFNSIQNQQHGHKHTLDVEGRNLEAYLEQHFSDKLDRLSFIKIDAEGYDKEIIKSISNLLRKYQPVIVSECNVHLLPEERFELYQVVKNLGYRIIMVDGFESAGKGVLLEKKEDMLRWKHFDIVAVKV